MKGHTRKNVHFSISSEVEGKIGKAICNSVEEKHIGVEN